MNYIESKQLPYTCKQMFDLIADIESYPAFLPGWSEARILHSDNTRLEVEQQFRIGLFTLRFHSTAKLEDSRRILITSNDAPFGTMTTDWHFTPLADNHCDVSVEIAMALQTGPFKRPLSRLLAHGGEELLALFEKRAHTLYSGI